MLVAELEPGDLVRPEYYIYYAYNETLDNEICIRPDEILMFLGLQNYESPSLFNSEAKFLNMYNDVVTVFLMENDSKKYVKIA